MRFYFNHMGRKVEAQEVPSGSLPGATHPRKVLGEALSHLRHAGVALYEVTDDSDPLAVVVESTPAQVGLNWAVDIHTLAREGQLVDISAPAAYRPVGSGRKLVKVEA